MFLKMTYGRNVNKSIMAQRFVIVIFCRLHYQLKWYHDGHAISACASYHNDPGWHPWPERERRLVDLNLGVFLQILQFSPSSKLAFIQRSALLSQLAPMV